MMNGQGCLPWISTRNLTDNILSIINNKNKLPSTLMSNSSFIMDYPTATLLIIDDQGCLPYICFRRRI